MPSRSTVVHPDIGQYQIRIVTTGRVCQHKIELFAYYFIPHVVFGMVVWLLKLCCFGISDFGDLLI